MGKIYFEAENESLKMINSDDILKAIKDNCCNRSRCKGCKYLNHETVRCRLVGVPSEWEFE